MGIWNLQKMLVCVRGHGGSRKVNVCGILARARVLRTAFARPHLVFGSGVVSFAIGIDPQGNSLRSKINHRRDVQFLGQSAFISF